MSIVDEIEKFIRPALSEKRFELVETQYRKESGNWVLRIFIDKVWDGTVMNSSVGMKGSGVTLDDCEKVSESVGSLLDSSGLLTDSYVLEVSSPGVNRPLKNESHFQRYVGEKVKIALYAPISDDSKQKNFSGVLLGCANQIVQVDDVVSGKVQIPISSIAKAHLDIL